MHGKGLREYTFLRFPYFFHEENMVTRSVPALLLDPGESANSCFGRCNERVWYEREGRGFYIDRQGAGSTSEIKDRNLRAWEAFRDALSPYNVDFSALVRKTTGRSIQWIETKGMSFKPRHFDAMAAAAKDAGRDSPRTSYSIS